MGVEIHPITLRVSKKRLMGYSKGTLQPEMVSLDLTELVRKGANRQTNIALDKEQAIKLAEDILILFK